MIKISQRKAGLHMAGVFLLLAMLGINCGGSNPANSNINTASLPGTWKFVSAQSLSYTVRSGQAVVTDRWRPTGTDVGERTTVSGSFTLTKTRFSLSSVVTVTEPGRTPLTKTVTAAGSYSVDGSTMKVFDDATGNQITLTVLQDNDQLSVIGNYSGYGITAIFEKQ